MDFLYGITVDIVINVYTLSIAITPIMRVV